MTTARIACVSDKETEMKKEDIHIGQRVRYIPTHASGDRTHPDCENGIVRSFNRRGEPFVVYDTPARGRLTSLELAKRWTAELTDPDDLEPL